MRRLDDSPGGGAVPASLVFGWVEPRFAEAAAELDAIEVRDPFAPAELDAILDGVDVGLMPSVWEEAYGYAGVEFLAKGIPVVANAIGGMPDYVRDGETGWLNRSCGAEELARDHGRRSSSGPAQVADLNAKLRARPRRDRQADRPPRGRDGRDLRRGHRRAPAQLRQPAVADHQHDQPDDRDRDEETKRTSSA